jgi:hypothetical protein
MGPNSTTAARRAGGAEWLRRSDRHPSEGLVRRLFGIWSAAIEQAGFCPQKGKQARSTEGVILDALRRWAEDDGVPRASDWITQASLGRQGRSSRTGLGPGQPRSPGTDFTSPPANDGRGDHQRPAIPGWNPSAASRRHGLETRAGGPSEPRPRLEVPRSYRSRDDRRDAHVDPGEGRAAGLARSDPLVRCAIGGRVAGRWSNGCRTPVFLRAGS